MESFKERKNIPSQFVDGILTDDKIELNRFKTANFYIL